MNSLEHDGSTLQSQERIPKETCGRVGTQSREQRLDEAKQKAAHCMLDLTGNTESVRMAAAEQTVEALLDASGELFTSLKAEMGAGQRIGLGGTEQDQTSSGGHIQCGTDHHFSDGDELHVFRSRDYFAQVEDRIRLQMLGTFIRDGGIRLKTYQKPFYERINDAEDHWEKALNGAIADKRTVNQIQAALSDYEVTVIDVYFSLGMKVGAQLYGQLMGGFDKDY